MALPVISIAAANLMSEYVFAPPQISQPAPTSRLDTMNASHHTPMKSGTLP
jgi:hypothetical protein